MSVFVVVVVVYFFIDLVRNILDIHSYVDNLRALWESCMSS